MLKASIGLNNLHILLPMVTTVSEVEEVLYLLERDWIAVQEEEQVKITKPKIGIMVEVPSVLLQIDEFAELVDFFSVGSNDLTQYLLAVDRNNPHVASVYSHFHPSILRVDSTGEGMSQIPKPVSICGEMAGDPLSAILLMAMGFNTLSMSSSNILRVRKAICHVPMTDAQKLLDDVMKMNNPLIVKAGLSITLKRMVWRIWLNLTALSPYKYLKRRVLTLLLIELVLVFLFQIPIYRTQQFCLTLKIDFTY